MFNSTTNDHDGNTLSAGLLIATSTSTTSSSKKYARLWRRSVTVSMFVFRSSNASLSAKYGCHWGRSVSDSFSTLKKTNYYPERIAQETDSNSLLQEVTNTNSNKPVHESGVFHFVSRACNSFSRKSSSNKEDSTSAPANVRVPPSSPVEHGLGRSLSTQSGLAIDMPSDNEEEEKTEHQKRIDSVVRIVKERDLNSLVKDFGGVEQVADVFGSHLENGIDAFPDRQVWETDYTVHEKGFFSYLLKACNSYTVFLLLLSAGLSFTTEMMEHGAKYGWHDGAAILLAVSMLVTFPSVANLRRGRKLRKKLWKEKNKLEVEVVRSQRRQFITISNLVAGDIVHLKKGDQIPADGLVVNNYGLELDDVLNPKIDRQRNPFLFYGSKVREGHGSMLVTSVGDERTLDKLQRLVIREHNEKRLLEAQTEKPNAFIENLSLFVSVLIALVAFIRLLCRKHHGDDYGSPELKGNVSVHMLVKIFERILLKPQWKISVLASALTVAVIAIQHGMPFVITISLSLWNEKVMTKGAKPQNLSACATMGIVTVICIDATGRLVCKDPEVDKFLIGEKDVMSNDVDFEIDQAVIEALKRGIGSSVLVPEISICPTNELFISWAQLRWSSDVNTFLDQNLSLCQYRKLREKGCGILLKNNCDEEKSLHMHWSGAASTILDMCSYYYDGMGNSHVISEKRSKFQELINDMEKSGLRPIAFACSQTEEEEIREDGLHLLALVGLKYPCPKEIKSAVEALRDNGVSIKLISEDELSAARAIGYELGIFRPETNGVELEGDQFRDLTPAERIAKTEQMTVMGSCIAEDKLLLVQSMQQKGDVVAFFGGSSTNDTPVFIDADVGITERTKCTEMARESCDIVISAAGSLPDILIFGRCAYSNIQKFTQLQLTVCISGLLITMVMTLSLEESPITTIQLIWVYWVVCLLGGLMMVMELPGQELITNSPGKRTLSLVTKLMWKSIVFEVLCQAFVLLIFQFNGQVLIPSLNNDIRKAMIFSSFTLCQVFNQFTVMAMGLVKEEMFAVVLRNYNFLVALGTVMVLQVLIVEFGGSLAGYGRLNGMQLGVCFLLAALSWGIRFVANLISGSLSKWSTMSDGSQFQYGFSRILRCQCFSCMVIPFSVLLLFSLTYY